MRLVSGRSRMGNQLPDWGAATPQGNRGPALLEFSILTVSAHQACRGRKEAFLFFCKETGCVIESQVKLGKVPAAWGFGLVGRGALFPMAIWEKETPALGIPGKQKCRRGNAVGVPRGDLSFGGFALLVSPLGPYFPRCPPLSTAWRFCMCYISKVPGR